MLSKKYTSGFCGSCHKNVPHRRWIGNIYGLLLDLLTLRLGRLLRIGPWYCVHCDNKVNILPLRKSKAIDYRSTALGNEMKPRKQINKSFLPPVASDSSDGSDDSNQVPAPTQGDLQPAESVGNFIKTESSLLVKSNRLQRYSEKYRDAVVRRILTGASSIMQIREEKQLSESEVTDWIADLFDRQQKKIDALESFKTSVEQSDLFSKGSLQDLAAGTQTVPGQIRPR